MSLEKEVNKPGKAEIGKAVKLSEAFLDQLRQVKQRDVEVLLKKSYRGIWETAIKKYSDSAHFVYELLQNADDAKATWVEFTLESDGLWFKHNGTVRFTISDPSTEDDDSEEGRLGHINAITSIGNTTKVDEQKIGKFGIGFKAVFAYSQTPRIYDDIFNFKLENYIVPTDIAPIGRRRKRGETLFHFPFNHKTKSEEEAFSEIEEKLETLFQPILFLSSLQNIVWVSEGKHGEYTKRILKSETFNSIKADLVEVACVEDGIPKKEQIWLFSSAVIHKELKSNHRISVGFFVLDQKELETGFQYEAFCFFPTKEETKLGFIIQAPFLLTDSREGIKAGERWNVEIVQLVANLAADSIGLLKEIGCRENSFLINDSILDLIPYRESDFSEVSNKSRISFKPFFSSIQQKFRKEELLPGRAGRYFSATKAYWASDPELAEMFSDAQLSELMENADSGFVFVSKGQKQLNQANKPLESYISSIVADTLDPKKLLRRVTSNFIEAQSDDWLLKFYSYLGGRKSLWDDKDKIALKRPIILNQDRKAIVPFDDDLVTPNIFIPTDRSTSYDTVYKPFIENEEALDFFKGLGLGKPDLKAEVFKTIIPQYKSGFDYDDNEALLSHFDSFLSYYELCPASSHLEFINKLRELDFVAARNRKQPDVLWLCQPEEVYFRNSKLESYFASSDDICFLDEEFYADFCMAARKESFYNFLTSLGVASTPRIKSLQLDVTTETKEQFALESIEVSQTYRSQSITDKVMEGLDCAVRAITPDISIQIWDYLLSYVQGKSSASLDAIFYGIFRYVPKWNSYQKSEYFNSTLCSILKNDRWLYNNDGNLAKAEELSKELINSMYNLDDTYSGLLMEFLGVENPDADLNLSEEQKKALNIGRKLLEQDVTQEELAEFFRMVAARKRAARNSETEEENEEELNDDRLQDTLNKLGKGIKKKRLEKSQLDADDLAPTPVPESESLIDQDEYIQPSVDLQKKIDKLKEQTEAQIEDLTRIEKLNELVNSSEKYSFAWFKALLELEYLSSSEANSNGKELSIQFMKVEREPDTERTLVLKHPNRYIPHSIEDIGDMTIRLYQGEETKSVTVEVVSVKEYSLRAKLKKSVDVSEIDFAKVNRAVIDIKNPVFILDELRKAFNQLSLGDEYNLQHNLTDKIRFIFGPPGTGKTTYLGEKEIIPLMREKDKKKVLVLTPTNKAADVLTNRIIEKMGADESYYEWLLRFGSTADPTLESSSIVVDKNFDITRRPRNTTITTIARFAYDYFQPDGYGNRLHLKFLEWDYIVIDEASMVNLASIAYVLYQRPEAFFIIAGDPFQIQPISQIEQWKDSNIYEMVHLDRFLDPVTVPHQYEIKNLQRQYRSIPSIGEVFSNFTYNGILEHNRSEIEQKPLVVPGLNFKDINIIKFPVAKFESIFKPNTLNKSNYQIYSAIFSVEFVCKLAAQINENKDVKFRIGVICPYKAQATLVEKMLAQRFVETENVEVSVGTIHGFQGDECDIIIAIFNPPAAISRSPNMFLNKQNILNVSISRARDYLFILMPDDSTENVENLYRIKRIEKLIVKHAAFRHEVFQSERIEQVMFNNQSYVYENSFATSHQSVNVYSKPEKKYEVRCEESAIDVQIRF
ncbi:MAG: DNA helicase [Flavobacterium sp.]|nr:MAG: DNA helicase [Flavobacterium sp.]